MQFKSFMEALKGKQHKIDKNKNGEIDAHDFKLLRKEEEELDEAEDRVARADYKVGPSGRKSHKEIVFHDDETKEDDKEEMREAKMSDEDMAERERLVKGMKKNLAGFKARYGDRAKEVMYATATKQAMKEGYGQDVNEGVNKSDVPAYLRKKTGDQLTTKDLEKERTQNRSHPETIKKINGTQNEEVEQIDEISLDTMKSAKEKLGDKAFQAHMDDNKYAAQHYAGRAMNMKKKIDQKKRKLANEEVEELDEKSDQARQNKTMKNLMAASKGAQLNRHFKLQPADYGYKKPQELNKAIGRQMMRAEEVESVDEAIETTHEYHLRHAAFYKRMGDERNAKYHHDRAHEWQIVANHNDTKRAEAELDRKYRSEEVDLDEVSKDDSEYNYEGEMAITQLKTICRHAEALESKLQPDTNLPEWVQSKITLAMDYLQTAHDYLMSELDEQAPVAPVPDKKYIKGTPEHKAYKATKKPINGMPTNVKETFDAEGNLINNKVSYKEFAMMLEYEAKDGRYVHKGSYGGSYVDPEGADDADDKKKKPTAEKRGRGRPAGAKSGAGKITGTSKLYK